MLPALRERRGRCRTSRATGRSPGRIALQRSTLVLLLVVVALAATSIWAWRALLEERARTDALQAQIDEEEPPVVVAAPNRSVGTASPVDEAAVAIDTQAESAPKNPEIFADKRRQLQSAAYRDARRRHRTLELTRGFFDLAKVVGISQKTADRLLALLVEKELEYLDRPQFNPRNEKEVRIRQLENQQYQQQRNAEIAALIGADKLAKWEQYEASLPIRHEVREMAGSVFGPVEPLRENQSEELIRVIHSERQRVRQELSEFTDSLVWSGGMESQSHIYRGERYGELTEAANDRIHAAASSFLSQGQLAALDERLRYERELQEAEFQEVRAMMEAKGISADEANSAARRSRQP